jgi:hypothetical protein
VLKLAALVLAAASTASTAPALKASSPWWEKVTVTVAADGKPKSCDYQSSLSPAKVTACEVSGGAATAAAGAGSSSKKDEVTRITFERRFTPGAQPGSTQVGAGDTLLGSQVMALAIDGAGAVKGCKIVSRDGDMTPDYGCEDASAEKFEASADRSVDHKLEGYMTILVYGHDEHVV